MPKKISEGAFTERERITLDPAEQEPAGYDEEPEEEPIDRLAEDDPSYVIDGVRAITVFGVDADARLFPRPFLLLREKDETGISGTGVVAHGVQFYDHLVALHWVGEHPSTVIWKNVDDMLAVHGHNGRTHVVWL